MESLPADLSFSKYALRFSGLIDRILLSVKSEKRNFVKTLAESLVRAEGRSRAIAFAMIFSSMESLTASSER